MSRPIGPKKAAAIEQVSAMRAQGIGDVMIREALIKSGLTKVQAMELIPRTEAEKLGLPAPMIVRPVDDEMKEGILNGAVHFLEGIAKRINPNMADRFPELRNVRDDSLTWAKKLKGTL